MVMNGTSQKVNKTFVRNHTDNPSMILSFSIQNKTGIIFERPDHDKNYETIIIGTISDKYPEQSYYTLDISLSSASGSTSFNINFCSFNPTLGKCEKPIPIIYLATGFSCFFIFLLVCGLAFWYYKRKVKMAESVETFEMKEFEEYKKNPYYDVDQKLTATGKNFVSFVSLHCI